MTLPINQIICADNVIGLRELPDESVDMVLTSPPYDNLRIYQSYSFAFEQLSDQLYRVLKKGGVIVWVVGDQTINGSESGTSFRQALHFMALGLKLHDTMIYRKENYIPLNHNRYDPEFEYMFVFSKGNPMSFNPIMQKTVWAGQTRNTKNRTNASSFEKNSALRRRDEDVTIGEQKMRGNVWSYQVGKNKGSKDDIWQHPATFPEQLAIDHVMSWSQEGDIVLDPFMGSGTTAKACLLLNRKFIGYEISEDYCKIAERRIAYLRNQMTIYDHDASV